MTEFSFLGEYPFKRNSSWHYYY